MIWHQGGPGGSSLHGMLYENGPCLSDGPNTTRFNGYSWAEHFNIIYLDQPAGVGFSYVDENGALSSRAEESALDSIAFIRLFYEAFPHLAHTDLHLAGESYAGRFIPAFASAILEYNQFFTSASDPGLSIPLRSLLLGNPWINPHVQVPSMYDVSCNTFRDQFQPHLDPEDCQKILPVVDRCESVLQACVLSRGDPFLCRQPHSLCQDQYLSTILNVTRSIYDRRLRHCQEPGNCYPDVTDPEAYLNSEGIFHSELDIPAQTNGHRKSWNMMSGSIFELYKES